MVTCTATQGGDEQREAIRALAQENYFCPDAAEILLEAAASPTRSEQRLRAQAALRALAMDVEPEGLGDFPPAIQQQVNSLSEMLLAAVYSNDPHKRQRITNLLTAVCREAQRVRHEHERRAA